MLFSFLIKSINFKIGFYFNAYWKEHSFIWNLVGVVFLTILILVFTYLFLALSRFISNYYENVIVPQIQKWSKGKIVTAEIYQLTLDRVASLESKVEVERKAKNEAINDRDELERQFFSRERELIDTGMKTVDKNNYDSIVTEGQELFSKEKLINAIIGIKKNNPFNSEEPVIDFLLKYSLIEFTSEDGFYRKTYKLNRSGESFYKKLLE